MLQGKYEYYQLKEIINVLFNTCIKPELIIIHYIYGYNISYLLKSLINYNLKIILLTT